MYTNEDNLEHPGGCQHNKIGSLNNYVNTRMFNPPLNNGWRFNAHCLRNVLLQRLQIPSSQVYLARKSYLRKHRPKSSLFLYSYVNFLPFWFSTILTS